MSEERQEDSAWVRVTTGLSPAELVAFCQDVERLLRINSMYEFEEWRREGAMHARMSGQWALIETPIRVEPRSGACGSCTRPA
jgi:hypothetical protein